MKILEIAGSGAIGTNHMGPVTNVTYQLSNEFHKMGHDVTVADVANPNRSVPFKIIETSNTPRVEDNSFDNEKKFIDQLINADLSQYDIIHTHHWLDSYFLHKYNLKTVYTSHTPTWVAARGLKKLRHLLKICLKRHEYSTIKETILTVALGNYLQIKKANVKVIPSGIHINKWERVPVDKEKFTIVFVGRISPIKGVNILIDAIRMISFPIQVYIIGSLSGVYGQNENITDYAKSMIQKARGLPVQFTGFINNNSEQFKKYLSMADLFIVPSLFEPQGTVVLEGLSMGIPVIASRTGGIPLMINDSVGRLFTPGNAKELAAQISELYYEEEIRLNMASRAKNHVISNFSWQKCAQDYIKEMRGALRSIVKRH